MTTSRKGLIIRPAIIALHGYKNTVVNRLAAKRSTDILNNVEVQYADKIINALRTNQPMIVEYENVCDILASAQQTLRIPIEEWEEATKLKLLYQ